MKWTCLLAFAFSPLAVLADCDFQRITDTEHLFKGTPVPSAVYIHEGDYVYPTVGDGEGEVGSICLNQGKGSWTFTMLYFETIRHTNQIFVFLVMDSTCHVRGIYVPGGCEGSGSIRGSFLQGKDEELAIVVEAYTGDQHGEYWELVPGYFKMAYGAGDYESEQGGYCSFVDTQSTEKSGRSTQLAACRRSFPIDGEGKQ